jgi:hypothetical protein
MRTVSEVVKQFAGPGIPVVFCGGEARLIGTLEGAKDAADVRPRVDLMLLMQRLSCTYISLGELRDTGQRLVVCHA